MNFLRPIALLITGILCGCEAQNAPTSIVTMDAQPPQTLQPVTNPLQSNLPGKSVQPQKVMLGSPELLNGIPGNGSVTVVEINKWLEDPANHAPLDNELPLGLEPGVCRIERSLG